MPGGQSVRQALLWDSTTTDLLHAGSVVTSAQFLFEDSTSIDDWITPGYGSDGYNIIDYPPVYPAYVQVTPSNYEVFVQSDPAGAGNALLRLGDVSRVSAYWLSPFGQTQFSVDIAITDDHVHRVGFYFQWYYLIYPPNAFAIGELVWHGTVAAVPEVANRYHRFPTLGWVTETRSSFSTTVQRNEIIAYEGSRWEE